MIKYFTFLLLFISIFANGQPIEKLSGKPKNLEETFVYLNQMFDDTAKYGFMTLPEDIATIRMHFGLGMWIRNDWGLWKNSELKQSFIAKGITDPDAMSSIILRAYHRYLNDQPINDGIYSNKSESKLNWDNNSKTTSITILKPYNITPDSVLLSLFPVRDTILVNVYASYRVFFTSYASSLRAIAVVKEHKSDKLLIQILRIKKSRRSKSERKPGDIYEERPINCSLLPPRGWRPKQTSTKR